MQIIRRCAYARAGLVGNPSDGYNGRTVSIILRNFRARVVLYEWPEVEVLPSGEDQSRFSSVRGLAQDVRLHGYYGGIRLVKATIKRFVEFCDEQNLKLHDRCFSVRYESNIPRQVGLAGSSAIIVATLRALMEFYEITIPLDVQPSLVLSVEMNELGITGGLQDRVIQVYEGVVSMDFSADRMQDKCGLPCGRYEPLDPTLIRNVYFAWSEDEGEPTEVFHNNLRYRYDSGEQPVVDAMRGFAELAAEAREALLAHDIDRLGECIDRNFDLRRSISRLPTNHERMIDCARAAGATAKFAGSGGAIIGTYPDESVFAELKTSLQAIGCRVALPIVTGEGS